MTRRSLLEGTTPGPWKVEPGAPVFVWAGKGSRIVTMASALYDSLLQFGEAEANARLIAAAPELAKENEELRAFLREYIERGWDGDHRFPMLHAEIKERATAILEREGL